MTAGAEPELPSERSSGLREPDDSGPLTGAKLRGLFAAASTWLERNAPAIDAINVFPVPDGDTGSNMAATLVGSVASVSAGLQSAGDVADALARGALLSARGNSGVILSQILRGFAEATSGADRLDGHVLSRALAEGSTAAYAAMDHPVEGTILSVARVASEAAIKMNSAAPLLVLEAALAGGRAGLARTPEELPVLKQAGVVDSGGYGLVVMLEGAVQFLRREAPPEVAHEAVGPRAGWIEEAGASYGSDSSFGYCTAFVVSGERLDVAVLRRDLETLGDSIIIAGDAQSLRIHLHTDDPGAALSHGTAFGVLTRIKVENMQDQYAHFVEKTAGIRTSATMPVAEKYGESACITRVAVVAGEGFAEITRSYGADVLHGGQTMNPSVAEILHRIEDAPAQRVIVLPNNRNVILTARQAARLSTKQVVVLKTVSVPQGINALLAFVADLPLNENVAAMQRAADAIHTVEVTRAVRATHLGDLQIAEGEPIGLTDGELSVTCSTSEDALIAATELLRPAAGAVAALYYGAAVSPQQADGAGAQFRERYPGIELEIIAGGQPLYDYILSLE